MSSSISFWRMNQAQHAAAAAANDQFFSDTTSSKLFTKGNPSASSVPNVMTPNDPNQVINGFGQAFLNHSMSMAILAAQAGASRVNKDTAAALNHTTTPPPHDFSDQVTFSGVLNADFGDAGPAIGGGYSFLSGKALKDAFKIAFGNRKSNGETVDTVSVFGDTLTGSTSGANAHDVFTLKLNRDNGIFEFKLVGPIDQTTKKGSYASLFIRGLMQAKTSNGQTVQLPNVEIDVYNDYGTATTKKNWGILHEGALTYQDPATAAATATDTSTTTTKTAYTAPTDTRTLRGYTSNPSAALSVINSVNIFS